MCHCLEQAVPSAGSGDQWRLAFFLPPAGQGGPYAQKKAPGNAVSQGGLGHSTFPGAIGRSATLTADWTVRSGVPGMSEARRQLPCRGQTLRGPLRSRPRRNPKCGPIHADKSLRRREYGICRPASRPNSGDCPNWVQSSFRCPNVAQANVNRRIWRFSVKMAICRRIGSHFGSWRICHGRHFAAFTAEIRAGFA